MKLKDSDFDCLFQDTPKEKLEEYSKMVGKLNKPSKWELKRLEDESFAKMLRKIKKIGSNSSFKILKKFYKEISVPGRGYHERYIQAANKAIWRIDLVIQDNREYEAMMKNELRRICDKDD